MKKIAKISSVILIIAMLTLVFSNTVVLGADSVIDQLTPDYSIDNGEIGGFGQKIVSYISIVGMVIAVVVLLILGIKYMIGSASEKAEYKKTMIPYLVGCVLVFAASAIASVIVNVVQGLAS